MLNKDDVQKAINHSRTKTEALTKLGYHPKSSHGLRLLNEAIEKFEISIDHFISPRKIFCDYYNQPYLQEVANKSTCYADMIRNLGKQARSGNFQVLYKLIAYWNVDVSRFNQSEGTHQSKVKNKTSRRVDLEDILAGHHPQYSSQRLKQRLLDSGYLEPMCSNCQIVEWNGEPLIFDLDHINGQSDDHRWENIRLLCPNCHSQTSTYKGRNIK